MQIKIIIRYIFSDSQVSEGYITGLLKVYKNITVYSFIVGVLCRGQFVILSQSFKVYTPWTIPCLGIYARYIHMCTKWQMYKYNIVSSSKWLEITCTFVGDTNIISLFGCIINVIVKKNLFCIYQAIPNIYY